MHGDREDHMERFNSYFYILPYRPLDNHAVDFPATFDVDFGNTLRGNTAAGSTRVGFRYSGERCLEGDIPPTGDEVGCQINCQCLLQDMNMYYWGKT